MKNKKIFFIVEFFAYWLFGYVCVWLLPYITALPAKVQQIWWITIFGAVILLAVQLYQIQGIFRQEQKNKPELGSEKPEEKNHL